jgi:hypothetical protein
MVWQLQPPDPSSPLPGHLNATLLEERVSATAPGCRLPELFVHQAQILSPVQRGDGAVVDCACANRAQIGRN